MLSPWRMSNALAATQEDEWHNADDLIPMAKRNTDNKSKSFFFFNKGFASLMNATLEHG